MTRLLTRESDGKPLPTALQERPTFDEVEEPTVRLVLPTPEQLEAELAQHAADGQADDLWTFRRAL